MIARRNVITLMVAIAASVACACSPRDRRTPDDTIVVVIEAAMTSSDPRYAISNYDSKLSKLVHAGLTAVDTDSMRPRLELASKVERAGGRDPARRDVLRRYAGHRR
jgi:hypothetical protein